MAKKDETLLGLLQSIGRQATGAGEAGATLASGLISSLVGMPYGVYKGMTSDKYGTPEGVRLAEQEAADFIARNTYTPRTEEGQNLLGLLGKAVDVSKAAPIGDLSMLAGIQGGMSRAAAARLADDFQQYNQQLEVPGASQVIQRRNVGATGFDPRFDPRVKEQAKLANLRTVVDERPVDVPTLSLADLEGKPVVISMSDRTGVGQLQGINDVMLNRPVELQGGKGFMHENPGMVWASAKGPVNQIMKKAAQLKAETGQDPLFMPWRMAPSGGDFASMTGETMLAYADASMTKTAKKALDKQMKRYIPDWPGVSSEKAIESFRGANDRTRKAIKNMLDTDFRDLGGIGIGEARLAVADPEQLSARDTGLSHIGQVFAGQKPIEGSGHAAYPYGVPGQGVGRLKEDLAAYQLLPEVAEFRGIPDPANPRTTDMRALQMKPYGTVITEGLLKRLGF